jgi:hypothetical protein
MHIGSDIVIYTTETCIDNTDKHIQRHGHTQTCTYKELVLKLLFNLRLKYSRLWQRMMSYLDGGVGNVAHPGLRF